MSDTDIGRMMDKDPFDMTKQDLDAIIAYQRERRTAFAQGDKKAGNMKAKPVQTREVKPIDLSDLE